MNVCDGHSFASPGRWPVSERQPVAERQPSRNSLGMRSQECIGLTLSLRVPPGHWMKLVLGKGV